MSVDEHTIELAGSPVFYRRAPSPGVPVLYLHGIPTSSDDWTAFLQRSGGVAPDLIGFGRSGKGGHLDYSIEGHTQFVRDFLDQLGLDRVKLVAHDWGAIPGLLLAQREPQRIERVVICNAIPLGEQFSWPSFVRLLRRYGVGELMMGSIPKRMLDRTLRRSDEWSEDQLDAIWEYFDQGTQRAILRLYRDATEGRLEAIDLDLDIPSLVVWGERDPWLSPQFADAYARRLHGAEVDRRAAAGHWPWLEDPGLVERVAQFLERP